MPAAVLLEQVSPRLDELTTHRNALEVTRKMFRGLATAGAAAA